jgi:hypothetical protein
MAEPILHFPQNDIEREAVEILRIRKKLSHGSCDKEEVRWAVSIIQRCDPNHPFLRADERSCEKPRQFPAFLQRKSQFP